ncbi:MAG: hypothetical protein GKR89_27175 [Candidatus Latescibacteria bacterium]|nr:hypothetical protein [Candidatus Latescibacterota bacterium]
MPNGSFSSPLLLGLLALGLLAACHDAGRKNPFDPALTPPVQLQVALDRTAGGAALSWTPYTGDRSFAAYWILRSVQGMVAQDTIRIADPAQTTYLDTAIKPDTDSISTLWPW